jgi:hypothetical protein
LGFFPWNNGAIFTKRVDTSHAWIGAFASIGLLLYVKLETDLNSLLYGAIGSITCFAVAYIFSVIIPTKTKYQCGLNIYNIPKFKK